MNYQELQKQKEKRRNLLEKTISKVSLLLFFISIIYYMCLNEMFRTIISNGLIGAFLVVFGITIITLPIFSIYKFINFIITKKEK